MKKENKQQAALELLLELLGTQVINDVCDANVAYRIPEGYDGFGSLAVFFFVGHIHSDGQ